MPCRVPPAPYSPPKPAISAFEPLVDPEDPAFTYARLGLARIPLAQAFGGGASERLNWAGVRRVQRCLAAALCLQAPGRLQTAADGSLHDG